MLLEYSRSGLTLPIVTVVNDALQRGIIPIDYMWEEASATLLQMLSDIMQECDGGKLNDEDSQTIALILDCLTLFFRYSDDMLEEFNDVADDLQLLDGFEKLQKAVNDQGVTVKLHEFLTEFFHVELETVFDDTAAPVHEDKADFVI